MLPNVLVIGAGKAGTTSMHYYLDQHPEISMSRVKEANFFEREDWRGRIDWYERLFDDKTAFRGEASPSYTVYPVAPGVPQRIRELIPEAKLIYLVRDPIERFVAHYSQHLVNDKERRSLSEAVRASLSGDDAPHGYLAASCYATQLDQYLSVFPSSSLHVIDSHELKREPAATMRDTFAFLGADARFESPRFSQIVYSRDDQVRFGRAGRRLQRSRLARIIRARVPREVRRPVTKRMARVLSEPVRRPGLDDDLRDRLADRLQPEADRLRELTGKPFESWSV